MKPINPPPRPCLFSSPAKCRGGNIRLDLSPIYNVQPSYFRVCENFKGIRDHPLIRAGHSGAMVSGVCGQRESRVAAREESNSLAT